MSLCIIHSHLLNLKLHKQQSHSWQISSMTFILLFSPSSLPLLPSLVLFVPHDPNDQRAPTARDVALSVLQRRGAHDVRGAAAAREGAERLSFPLFLSASVCRCLVDSERVDVNVCRDARCLSALGAGERGEVGVVRGARGGGGEDGVRVREGADARF